VEFLFRHRSPRRVQKELMLEIYAAVKEGKHLIAHAPTGTGKTDATISAALTYTLDAGKTLLFLSPKISQHEMALNVVAGISKKHSLTVKTVEFVGKQYMCVHPLARRLKGEEFYELCKRMREKELCPYYCNYLEDERSSFWPLFGQSVISHDVVIAKADAIEECPYEVASELLSDADVVIGDYYHLFSPRSGEVFRKKLSKKLSDVVLIVDEAHNLPDRIRRVISYSLSTKALESAAKEAAGLDPEVSALLREASEDLKNVASSMAPGEERAIDRADLISWWPFDFTSFAEELEDLGREYLELSGKGKSALLKVARFLSGWAESEGPFLHYIHFWKDGTTVSVARKALDPSVLSEEIFSELHSAVLVSGTLTPGGMYRDLLGLDPSRTVIREYPSPFPRENRLVLIVPSVTTRYSRRRPSEFERIAGELRRIVSAVPGNVAVFFPSYDVLFSVLPFADFAGRPLFVQKPDMKPEEVASILSSFRSNSSVGAVLFAVAGGSLSEGVDYPGSDLLAAVIVGIPLAEMNLETKAIIEYFEEKMGKGWAYGYIYPAVAKAVQAAGRVIRSEKDRGVIVLLDERYTWKNYYSALPRDWDPVITEDPVPYIRRFWNQS